MESRAPNLTSLTALRFLAALLVVVFHAEGLPAAFGPVKVGYVGVTFFFVLSGFVLTWSSRPGIQPGAFYWRRFARVWPLHALTTVLAVVLGLAYADGGSLVANLLLLTGMMIPANPPSWSLATEAFFYATFPLLIVWIRRCRRLRLVALGCIASGLVLGAAIDASVGAELQWSYRCPLARLGEFVLGMTVATALMRDWRPPRLSVAVATTIGTYLLIWLLGGEVSGSAPMYFAGYTLALPFALVIAAMAVRELSTGTAAPAWAEALGRWSFALYLLHWPVMRAIDPLELNSVAALALALVVSIGLAGVFHASFERPVERWLRSRALLRLRVPVAPSATAPQSTP